MAEERIPMTALLKNAIQIGLIVDDLDKAIAGMRLIFDVEPVFVKEMPYPWVRYRGELSDVRAHVASYDQFGIQLEFIKPLGTGKSTWQDHLDDAKGKAGFAIHHIRFNDVEDNDAVSALMKERGIDVVQEGASVVNPSGRFTYYDTREVLGFVVEVVTKV